MPTMQTVARGTRTSDTETVRVESFDKLAKLLEPDAGQLTTFLMNFKATDQVKNPQVKWVEDEYDPRFDSLSAGLTAGATTMSVNNFAYFRNGDLVKIANREVVRVTATPTTGSVTITRDIEGVGALAANANDQLFIYSDANQENSSARDILSVQKVVVHNFLQIMRTNWAASQTHLDSDNYGGDDWAWQKRKALATHKRKMDNVGIHGVRSESTVSSQFMHTSGGILSYIDTNVFDAGGEFPEPELESSLRKTFRYRSSNRSKLGFCSPQPITVINSYGREKLITDPSMNEYGISMTGFKNAGRKLKLIEHDQLTNDSLDDLTGMAGYIIIIDVEDVRLKYMGSALITSREHIESKGVDGRQDEYRSQAGFQFVHEKRHGLIKGITH